MNSFHPQIKLGVLGGGQLGQMMIPGALNLGLAPFFLDPNPDCSVARYTDQLTIGSFQDYETVVSFGRDKDVITVEIEHVNVEALEQLESQGIKVFPSSKVLRIVQDKGLQKQFYMDNGIPTSDFSLIESIDNVPESEFPFVLKARTGGYDGKGVKLVRSQSDLQQAFHGPLVKEMLIDVEKEISILLARNEAGDIQIYPAIEMVFDPQTNLVTQLFAPSTLNSTQQAEAEEMAQNLVEKIDMVGILAVELFLTPEGKILVNEIAPRPHNSGHHTIEANYTSQFEQHLRAVCGFPLGSTEAIAPAVMINLVGDVESDTGVPQYHGFTRLLQTGNAFLHLYGKNSVSPARKMGHVTILDSDLSEAIKLGSELEHQLKISTSV